MAAGAAREECREMDEAQHRSITSIADPAARMHLEPFRLDLRASHANDMTELRVLFGRELCERLAGTTEEARKARLMADYLREPCPCEAAGVCRPLSRRNAIRRSRPPQAQRRRRAPVEGAARSSAGQATRPCTPPIAGTATWAPRPSICSRRATSGTATLTIDESPKLCGHGRRARCRSDTERRQSAARDLLRARHAPRGEVPDQADAGRHAHRREAGLVEEAIAVATRARADRRAPRRDAAGDLSEVVRLADAGPLDEARMRLFHPLGFMLASPVDSVEEAMARFAEEVRAEQKGEGGAKPTPETEGTSESAQNAVEGTLVEAHVPPALTLAHIRRQVRRHARPAALRRSSAARPRRALLPQSRRHDAQLSRTGRSLREDHRAADSRRRNPGLGHRIPLQQSNAPLPFSSSERIGRKRVTPTMREQTPVIFMAFDLLYRGDVAAAGAAARERRAPAGSRSAPRRHRTRSSATLRVNGRAAQPGLLFANQTIASDRATTAFARLCPRPIARSRAPRNSTRPTSMPARAATKA